MNTLNIKPAEAQAPSTARANSLGEVHGFMARCHEMIEKVRKSLINADLEYRVQRAALCDRYQDDLERLDERHGKVIAEHQVLLAKLEELRR